MAGDCWHGATKWRFALSRGHEGLIGGPNGDGLSRKRDNFWDLHITRASAECFERLTELFRSTPLLRRRGCT